MRKTIYLVDDSDVSLAHGEDELEDLYNVITLPSAFAMFRMLDKKTPNLILLDIEMPVMNGFEALKRLKDTPSSAHIPVIFLTGRDSPEIEVKGFELGAVDFIRKPFSPQILRNRIKAHLDVDDVVRDRTARVLQLKNGIVSVLAEIVECRDSITGSHIERTSSFLKILMDEMAARGLHTGDLTAWDIETVIASARLHDVGKIAVSDSILQKPGRLTPDEFNIVKTHTTEGVRIIGQIAEQAGDESFLSHAKVFAGCHHERWNGKGYPKGLKGGDIPLQGRIMAIADVYDALVSERPYKKPFSHEEAVKIIMDDAGEHFDPEIAEVFFGVRDQFREVE